MNILEKILEEIKEAFDENIDDIEDSAGIHHFAIDSFTAWYIARKIIRSHMDEVPKCGECSRRKWHQIGYEDGKKEDGWIPYTSQNIPKKENVYLVTCDDEEYPVKRMRFKKEDEYGLWYDNYGIYDGLILAWQPLPEPYKEE